MDAKYGELNVTCHYDLMAGLFQYDYHWEGGHYLALSRILADVHPEFKGQWVPGTKIKIGPFTMRVIGLIGQDVAVCKRLTPVWWARFMVWLKK